MQPLTSKPTCHPFIHFQYEITCIHWVDVRQSTKSTVSTIHTQTHTRATQKAYFSVFTQSSMSEDERRRIYFSWLDQRVSHHSPFYGLVRWSECVSLVVRIRYMMLGLQIPQPETWNVSANRQSKRERKREMCAVVAAAVCFSEMKNNTENK